MKAAMEILNEKCNCKSLHCTTHCLQLCILIGFSISVIGRLLLAAKNIVAHFHHIVEAVKEKQT